MIFEDFKSVIKEKFIDITNDDEIDYARNFSWDYCYHFFYTYKDEILNKEEFLDLAALHLNTYLASWGMYRGSGFLLKYCDYTVYKPLIKELLQNYKDKLYVDRLDFTYIKCAEEYIDNYFREIRSKTPERLKNEDTLNKDTSQTLTTKILLGVFGCVPAFDTFVKNVLSKNGISQKLNSNSYDAFRQMLEDNNVDELKEKYKTKCGDKYPLMKLLDMYLWEIGKRISKKDL
ncbi:MAG: hypothetical protein NC200_03420 [Candidatus Gastranaerophilales bacterium]|nr:hypothetical protein [Candidatus Gastranaerophilales bacterium]